MTDFPYSLQSAVELLLRSQGALTTGQIYRRLNLQDRPTPGTVSLLLHWWWSSGKVQPIDHTERPLRWSLFLTEEMHLIQVAKLYDPNYLALLKWHTIFARLDRTIAIIDTLLLE